jgi:uncharacterized protein YcbX
MFIEKISTYPIKSLPPILTHDSRSINSAKITSTGIENDRAFCLVNSNEQNPQTRWISQRNCPQLALFKLKYADYRSNKIIITHRDYLDQSIEIDLQEIEELRSNIITNRNKTTYNKIDIDIWGDEVICSVLDKKYSQFFSDILGMNIQLITYLSRNISTQRYKFPDIPTLQDGYPISAITTSTLSVINAYLEKIGGSHISDLNFRSNILINNNEYGEAFEKYWKRLEVLNSKGENILFLVQENIPRCIMTQVDPKRGEVEKNPVVKTILDLNKTGRPTDVSKRKARAAAGLYPHKDSINKKIEVDNEINVAYDDNSLNLHF